MTRIALISDIHGNLPALENVMQDMQQFAPDHVVVAGNMVNWGPFSAEVMQIVIENNWAVIRGNNEFYVLNAHQPRRPESWAGYTMLGWLHDQLTEWHHTIATLPDELLLLYPDAPDTLLCHGIPGNCWQGIYDEHFTSDEQITDWLGATTTIFCGHTHVPLNRHAGQYHIINPGTVGVPLVGDLVSSYMILESTPEKWTVAEHRILPMDNARLFPMWEQQQFVERCGAVAHMVIEEFKQARIMVHSFNTWLRAVHPDEAPTLAHVETFLKLDANPYIPLPYRQTNAKS